MIRALGTAFGLLAVLSAGAVAQEASPVAAHEVSLDTVEARLARGDYDGARSTIEAWWSAPREGSRPTGTERARALLLRARLAPDLAAAESDYLAVILGYPSTSYAADALVRLGQGLVVAGSPDRAVDYLEQFRIDFPDHRRSAVGLLWLARAYGAASDAAQACTTARSGVNAVRRDPRLRSLLEREAEAACAEAARVAAAGAAVDTTIPESAERDAPEPTRRTEPSDPSEPSDASGRFAVQTGAFRYERGAESLAARLREAGYRPRLVHVPGSTLLRVRIGRFERPADATALARRIRDAGFDAVVVRDADRERER